MSNSLVEVLLVARVIANRAKDEGALFEKKYPRATCDHLGAVIADSILQAGLNYMTVVRPRIFAIIENYPSVDTVSSLMDLIETSQVGIFLKWSHFEKIKRFEALVIFLQERGVEDVQDLRLALNSLEFCKDIQTVNGVGPKTVDYMACLVGIDSIAVDRHVRAFARAAGVENDDYYFLRRAFCFAADLLSLPRREFDAWLWRRAATPFQEQLSLAV